MSGIPTGLYHHKDMHTFLFLWFAARHLLHCHNDSHDMQVCLCMVLACPLLQEVSSLLSVLGDSEVSVPAAVYIPA